MGTPLCVRVAYISLHAAVTVPARDRRRLERLCRYVARPAVASERLAQLDDVQPIYRLKHRWCEETAAFVFEPEEFVARLAALVPSPAAARAAPRATRARRPYRCGADAAGLRTRRAGVPAVSRPDEDLDGDPPAPHGRGDAGVSRAAGPAAAGSACAPRGGAAVRAEPGLLPRLRPGLGEGCTGIWRPGASSAGERVAGAAPTR